MWLANRFSEHFSVKMLILEWKSVEMKSFQPEKRFFNRKIFRNPSLRCLKAKKWKKNPEMHCFEVDLLDFRAEIPINLVGKRTKNTFFCRFEIIFRFREVFWFESSEKCNFGFFSSKNDLFFCFENQKNENFIHFQSELVVFLLRKPTNISRSGAFWILFPFLRFQTSQPPSQSNGIPHWVIIETNKLFRNKKWSVLRWKMTSNIDSWDENPEKCYLQTDFLRNFLSKNRFPEWKPVKIKRF